MSLRERLMASFPALRRVSPPSYVVGGAVRDLLLGREPADVDVACLDPRAAAERVRPKTIRLGDAEHLSAYRVVDHGHTYDFAALLDDSIDADLARRDFTVNAIAVDLATGALLDPHDGQRDLVARVVRMIDPKNFDDDPLRTLKGVRMAVRLGFDIEPATLNAIRARAQSITTIAPERVTYELSIILGAGVLDRAFALLEATGLADALLLRAQIEGPIREAEASLAAACAFLVDDPKSYAERWRWSDQLLRDVLTLRKLVTKHDRVALYDAGERVASQLPPLLRLHGRDDVLDLPDFAIRPLLDGREIAEATALPPGRELGAIKRGLLEAQVRGEVTTREEALRRVADQVARAGSSGRRP